MGKYQKNKKTYKAYRLLFLIGAIFLATTVFFTIQTATAGATLAKLEQDEKQLREQNRDLKSKLIDSSSLVDLSKKAEQLGFKKPEMVHYLSAEEAVAKLP
jgi:hypothetical protein